MAKKSSINISEDKDQSVFGLISSVDKSAEILSESKTALIKDYINTGSYILNACMTGSLFKGVPTGRVLTIAGEPGAGKSFLAVSICREAQKKGYTPVYMDSEGAIDREFVERLGCDSSKFVIKQVTTITEVSTFMANLLQKVNEQPEDKRVKLIFVLDSLGNLTSTKELTDTLEANNKRDMSKQQEIKALFRTNATALAKAQAPMIVCSHIYKTMDLFSKNIVSGGCLIPDEIIITKEGKKKIKDVKVGEYVLTVDGEFHEVLETYEFEKPTIKFVFENGETIECSENHRFLVGTDPTLESNWKTAKELNKNDIIFKIDI